MDPASHVGASWRLVCITVLIGSWTVLGCSDDATPGSLATAGSTGQGMNPVGTTAGAAAGPAGTGAGAAGTGAGVAGTGVAGTAAIGGVPVAGVSGVAGGLAAGSGAAETTAGASGGGSAGTSGGAAAMSGGADAGGASGEGAAGSGGAGAAGSPAAGSGGPPAMREDLGMGDGTDVIAIGDSWMNLGTAGIQQSLNKASGQRYRTYGVPGTRLVNNQIPNQYTSAKRADPDIKTVVMTGGGNDIIQVPGLRDDCDAGGDMCAMVVGMILDRLSSLWMEMSKDGVQDIVYVQYSNPEGMNVDFALPDGDGVAKRCAEVPAPTRCHRLETLDIVMGDIPDSIHPSAVAFDRIGVALYDLMKQEGMRR